MAILSVFANDTSRLFKARSMLSLSHPMGDGRGEGWPLAILFCDPLQMALVILRRVHVVERPRVADGKATHFFRVRFQQAV